LEIPATTLQQEGRSRRCWPGEPLRAPLSSSTGALPGSSPTSAVLPGSGGVPTHAGQRPKPQALPAHASSSPQAPNPVPLQAHDGTPAPLDPARRPGSVEAAATHRRGSRTRGGAQAPANPGATAPPRATGGGRHGEARAPPFPFLSFPFWQ
jgi:hypothetical protein